MTNTVGWFGQLKVFYRLVDMPIDSMRPATHIYHDANKSIEKRFK